MREVSAQEKRHLLVLFFIIPFLMGMSITLYVPSLPAITTYFQTKESLVQLTISFYMLGYSIGQLFLGLLSETIGRRRVLLFSGAIYVAASFLAPFSSSIYYLIFFRLLQGIGMAGLSVMARAIATDLFKGPELANIMNHIIMNWSLGPVIGPFIGSYLEHLFNWQANFYFFGLYSTLLFVYASVTLKESNNFLRELDVRATIVKMKTMVTSSIFLIGAIIVSCFYGSLIIFNVVGPFLFQIVLKYSVIRYGHIALFLGLLGSFAGSTFNHYLLKHFNAVKIASFAAIISLFSAGIMIILSLAVPLNVYIIVFPMLIIFFCASLIFPNVIARIMSIFPKDSGTENAIFGTMFGLGAFILTGVAALIKTTTSLLPLALIYTTLFIIGNVLLVIIIRFDQKKLHRE